MSFPDLLEKMLVDRGISPKETEDFLHPDYGKLHNPLLLPDMEKARDRVIGAIEKGEHIMIFSDYDADGIPGAAVCADFFRRAAYDNVSFYIPHRHDEGFGLNCQAVDVAVERGAKLIVTVDCGIADVHEVAYANKQGIDVIITDHHEPGSVLPEAYAIVDHKRKDSVYPFPELCGAAMAYKLVLAILEKERFGIKEGMEKWSLDMVGIATLSDMVPLVGENRILATFGLNVLRKSPRPGLAALLKKLAMDQEHLTEDDIAFMITPRINAASRMGVPMDAFKLLSTDSPLEADRLAMQLEKINNERKGIVASLVKDAKKHVEMREHIGAVIVVGNPEWRPALLGLVANSLVEEYDRPVFVWGRDGDGTLKGSCRTCKNIDLHKLMSAVPESFIEFGGHKGAGGFSATLEHITTLEDVLCKACEQLQSVEVELPQNDSLGGETAQYEISLADVNESLHLAISQIAPFGTGNPKPLLIIPNAEIKSARSFGKTGDHLEVVFRSEAGKDVKAISFFSNPESFKTPLKPGLKPTVHAHLEKSFYRNRPELRLRIVDILSA